MVRLVPRHAQIKPVRDSIVVCRGVGVAKASRKYTLPYFQVQRAKMILLAAEGLNNDEIAARLDSRREVVGRWRKRFFTIVMTYDFTERLNGLEEQARPGRPRTLSPRPRRSG